MFSEFIRLIIYVIEDNFLVSICTLFLIFLAPFMIKSIKKTIENLNFSRLHYKNKIYIVTYFSLLFSGVIYIITTFCSYYNSYNIGVGENMIVIENTNKVEEVPTDYDYYENELKYYLEALESEDDSKYADEYRRAIQYYVEKLEKEGNPELANSYERIIQYYLELLRREGNSKIEESDLKEIRDQIGDLTLSIIDINEKIDNLNSTIEQSNNNDIISSCITGFCTILAAFIAAKSVTTVVIKYKNRNTTRR